MPGLFSCCFGSNGKKSLRVKQQEENGSVRWLELSARWRHASEYDSCSGWGSCKVFGPLEIVSQRRCWFYGCDRRWGWRQSTRGFECRLSEGVSLQLWIWRYRNVQSIYMFTSEELGVGATGPIRAVINKWGTRFWAYGKGNWRQIRNEDDSADGTGPRETRTANSGSSHFGPSAPSEHCETVRSVRNSGCDVSDHGTAPWRWVVHPPSKQSQYHVLCAADV